MGPLFFALTGGAWPCSPRAAGSAAEVPASPATRQIRAAWRSSRCVWPTCSSSWARSCGTCRSASEPQRFPRRRAVSLVHGRRCLVHIVAAGCRWCCSRAGGIDRCAVQLWLWLLAAVVQLVLGRRHLGRQVRPAQPGSATIGSPPGYVVQDGGLAAAVVITTAHVAVGSLIAGHVAGSLAHATPASCSPCRRSARRSAPSRHWRPPHESHRRTSTADSARRSAARAALARALRDYVELTKPRIVVLELVTSSWRPHRRGAVGQLDPLAAGARAARHGAGGRQRQRRQPMAGARDRTPACRARPIGRCRPAGLTPRQVVVCSARHAGRRHVRSWRWASNC